MECSNVKVFDGKYAVWKNDEAVTAFEYDECGSAESGLLAAKKDGKWGYINEDGEIVIRLNMMHPGNIMIQQVIMA